MCGFRMASATWRRDWQKTIGEVGDTVGWANTALLYNEAERSRRSVHGDDVFAVSGEAINWALAPNA